MKDKILVFIIGLLLGAVITASGFLIYEKNNQNTTKTPNQEKMQMMERPDGETPPEKPDGENNNENRPEPPARNNTSKENKEN